MPGARFKIRNSNGHPAYYRESSYVLRKRRRFLYRVSSACQRLLGNRGSTPIQALHDNTSRFHILLGAISAIPPHCHPVIVETLRALDVTLLPAPLIATKPGKRHANSLHAIAFFLCSSARLQPSRQSPLRQSLAVASTIDDAVDSRRGRGHKSFGGRANWNFLAHWHGNTLHVSPVTRGIGTRMEDVCIYVMYVCMCTRASDVHTHTHTHTHIHTWQEENSAGANSRRSLESV